MDIQKGFLRRYLHVAAINQGLMKREIAVSLENYEKDTFLLILHARVERLQSESQSETAFFSSEYYASEIETVREAIDNIDVILAQPS